MPNNSLKNYKTILNNGFIKLNENKFHKIKFEVYDSYDNKSDLSFIIKETDLIYNDTSIVDSNSITKTFNWYHDNEFSNEDFKLSIKKNYLYETIEFNYLEKDSVEGVYGKVYQCHFETVPLHKSGKLSIRSNVPDKLKDKVYIAKLKNNKFQYFGNKWENNFLTAKISQFGDFAIVADTIKQKLLA